MLGSIKVDDATCWSLKPRATYRPSRESYHTVSNGNLNIRKACTCPTSNMVYSLPEAQVSPDRSSAMGCLGWNTFAGNNCNVLPTKATHSPESSVLATQDSALIDVSAISLSPVPLSLIDAPRSCSVAPLPIIRLATASRMMLLRKKYRCSFNCGPPHTGRLNEAKTRSTTIPETSY